MSPAVSPFEVEFWYLVQLYDISVICLIQIHRSKMITNKHNAISLMQLHLVRLFLYSLNYCIREVIKGKMFWILYLNLLTYEADTAWNRGMPSNFIKTLIQLYLFYLFQYFWLTVTKRVSKTIFLDIKFKSVGLWVSYGLKQGNPLQDLKIANQIIYVLSPDILFNLMDQNGY